MTIPQRCAWPHLRDSLESINVEIQNAISLLRQNFGKTEEEARDIVMTYIDFHPLEDTGYTEAMREYLEEEGWDLEAGIKK